MGQKRTWLSHGKLSAYDPNMPLPLKLSGVKQILRDAPRCQLMTRSGGAESRLLAQSESPPQGLLPSSLAPGAKRADPRPTFSNPRTSEELATSEHQWSSEKMVTANPQGEKNVERS